MARLIVKCCNNCRKKLRLEEWEYMHSDGGTNVYHTKCDGYVCLAFADEGLAVWMTGTDPNKERCEVWSERHDE